MKKLSTGFVAIALCLGLTACGGGNEQQTGEATDDLNRMESPAAGGSTMGTDPAAPQDYNTGGTAGDATMGTGAGMGTGTGTGTDSGMGGTTGSDYGTGTMGTPEDRAGTPGADSGMQGTTPQQ